MVLSKNTFIFSLLLLMNICLHQVAFAQCTSPIATFPYNEDFENSTNGNWVPNPSASWQCGTPSTTKQVIRTTGGGLKSWIVGGLTGSSYASGNSELRSPCFDFSTLTNPEISFKVFWETERRFDGASFQYSLNEGSTWTTLGSVNSNSTCVGTNWFTYNPIDYLGGEPGWSGNIQTSGGGGNNCFYGLGSGAWVNAKHNMSMLAGVNKVIFRFIFGAGTQCNDFDGFAIDDVHIGEAPPPNVADFTYTCGPNNQVNFTNNSSACSIQWNFGDPASGQNTSTLENPVHVFSTPGQQYTVTLTANFATASAIKSVTIYTLGISIRTTDFNKCNGDSNYGFTVDNVIGGQTGIYTYSWNTNPVQTTQSVSNLPLGTGNYTVTVSSPNACSSSVVFIVTDPPVLNISATPSPAKCASNNGSIISTVAGGEAPYSYSWNTDPVQTTSSLSGLAPGIYALTVTDNKGCIKNVNDLEVKAVVNQINVFLGNDVTICPGQSLVLDPGTFAAYLWQDNSTSSTYTVTRSGTYSVKVTDNDGCTGTSSIKVTVDCKDVYFPSAFTPNEDPLNPTFGPVGDLNSLKKFNIVIYNRYGQVIFTSNDPFKKWDGTYKGKKLDTGSYVWIATYTQSGRLEQVKKGSITIVR